MITDLGAEFAVAFANMNAELRRPLRERGVGCLLVGSARIATEGRFYTPDPNGSEAYIFPALVQPHLCCDGPARLFELAVEAMGNSFLDLIAWRPSEPELVYSRIGNVAALGEAELHWFCDSPLKIWTSPVSWLAANTVGCVILDWPSCAPLLLGREIICETLALGDRADQEIAAIRRHMMSPRPKIFISQESRP